MPRITSLSMLLDTTGKDFLSEEYGKVIENIEKRTISSALKNRDLSGTPTAGSMEAKRFANAQSQPYGTSRAAGKGQGVKAKPVTVPVDVDRELIEEIEEKDIALYGVEGTVKKRISNHQSAMTRELERAFFAKASATGTALTTTETAINKVVEAIIQQIESTKNDFVDGVDRDMISVTLNTANYGLLRDYLDSDVNNSNVDTSAAEFGIFHGVRIYSSVYLPTGTEIVAMADGSIAQPVRTELYAPKKVDLSNATAFGLFYNYGATAVMPDLIVIKETK